MKRFCKCFIFLMLLLIGLTEINNILTPKFYFNTSWPTTSALSEFYNINSNTVDLIFLGSSRSETAFSPQVIYNECGIKSYNLSTEQQNLLISYYMLKESLKYQMPKVVILECNQLFAYNVNEPLNSSEACTRKVLDFMKWSMVKIDAIKDVCKYDDNQTIISYFLSNIRYHTRWKELNESDYNYKEMEKASELMGYNPFYTKLNVEGYNSFVRNENIECEEMLPLMREYLDKIVDLCNEKEIELILVKTPSPNGDINYNLRRFNTINKYAVDNGLEYWDFNEEDLYNKAEFSYLEDMKDTSHVNIQGAEKLSTYIAKVIGSKYDFNNSGDVEQWEKSKDYYQRRKNTWNVVQCEKFTDYLGFINSDNYTILITTSGDVSSLLTGEVVDKFNQLGLYMNYISGENYIAAIHEGTIIEKENTEEIVYKGSTRGKLLDFEITSSTTSCSIKLHNVEASKKSKGINIVVYDNELMKTVDSIYYDGVMHR